MTDAEKILARRQEELARRRRNLERYDSFSVETKACPRRGSYEAVYGWGTYSESSVLAGQAMKVFLEGFDTVEEALRAYPKAEVGFRDAHNTYNHLPSEDDPVPGGMYPDDIDPGSKGRIYA